MSSQVICLSVVIKEIPKEALQLGSCSSGLERPESVLNPLKALQVQFRSFESFSNKPEYLVRALNQKHSFERHDQNMNSEVNRVQIVDVINIRKVNSPFAQSQGVFDTQYKQQISETNFLVSSFNSTPQKVEQFIQNPVQIKEHKQEQEPSQFQNLTPKIIQMTKLIQQVSKDKQVCFYQGEFTQKMDFECHYKDPQNNALIDLGCFVRGEVQEKQLNYHLSIEKSSTNLSTKTRSSQLIRLKKKNKKRMIRKEKKKIAKSIKAKLQNISTFFDSLHQNKIMTNRKQLVEQLTSHLCERKFGRLRNELKKLI